MCVLLLVFNLRPKKVYCIFCIFTRLVSVCSFQKIGLLITTLLHVAVSVLDLPSFQLFFPVRPVSSEQRIASEDCFSL